MEAPENSNSYTISPCSVMLCRVCDRTISSIKDSRPGVYNGLQPELFGYAERADTWRGAHHAEQGSFVSAVNGRCYICYALNEACTRELRKYAESFRTFYEIQPHGHDRYSLQFTIELRQDSSLPETTAQVIEPYGTFKILPKTNVPDVGVRLGLTKNTFTGKCREQVRDWLAECTAIHSTCNEDWRTGRCYPLRLLNVRPEMGEKVCLDTFSNGNMANLPRYVTMSHCWNHGREVHLMKLTTENCQQFKSGFPISALPQKFYDAIKIARWMKVDYLWIDALCILQDSKDDWQQQSSVMGDIYGGSYCNIAATNGDEDKGCFRDRPVEIVEPYFIRDPKLSSLVETHVIGYDDFWCNSLLDTALHTRAWVLQERLLSPRTVHFGKEQIFWECRCHKACEAYPTGVPAEFTNRRTDAWRQGEEIFNPESKTMRHGVFQSLLERVWSTSKSSQNAHIIPVEQAYNFWSTTVEHYMKCNLSVSSDKLVAIAGIANKVKETTSERYLAGLWDNVRLPQSLLWYVSVRKQADGQRSVRYPSLGKADYRAPSWSWASLDARVIWKWPAECDQVLVNIKGTYIEVSGDEMGAITSAEMHVEGHLIAVQLQIMHKHENGSPKEDGSYALVLKHAHFAAAKAELMSELPPLIEPIVYLDTALSPDPSIDAYLLPVCTQWQNSSGLVIATIAGLILKRGLLAERMVYERIGVFGLDDYHAHVIGYSGASKRDVFAGMANTESVILI